MTRAFLTCGLLLIGLASPIHADTLKDEFTRLAAVYDTALLTQDAKSLALLYDDNGRFVSDDGRVMLKKEYIEANRSIMWKTAKTTIHEVRQLSDNVVIETGDFRASGSRPDGRAFDEQQRYIAVWLKKDNRWQITAEQTTTVMTVPSTE